MLGIHFLVLPFSKMTMLAPGKKASWPEACRSLQVGQMALARGLLGGHQLVHQFHALAAKVRSIPPDSNTSSESVECDAVFPRLASIGVQSPQAARIQGLDPGGGWRHRQKSEGKKARSSPGPQRLQGSKNNYVPRPCCNCFLLLKVSRSRWSIRAAVSSTSFKVAEP